MYDIHMICLWTRAGQVRSVEVHLSNKGFVESFHALVIYISTQLKK